jgi:hypothetical protein
MYNDMCNGLASFSTQRGCIRFSVSRPNVREKNINPLIFLPQFGWVRLHLIYTCHVLKNFDTHYGYPSFGCIGGRLPLYAEEIKVDFYFEIIWSSIISV